MKSGVAFMHNQPQLHSLNRKWQESNKENQLYMQLWMWWWIRNEQEINKMRSESMLIPDAPFHTVKIYQWQEYDT